MKKDKINPLYILSIVDKTLGLNNISELNIDCYGFSINTTQLNKIKKMRRIDEKGDLLRKYKATIEGIDGFVTQYAGKLINYTTELVLNLIEDYRVDEKDIILIKLTADNILIALSEINCYIKSDCDYNGSYKTTINDIDVYTTYYAGLVVKFHHYKPKIERQHS